MTDSQIIVGILQNDEQVWRYIYRTMKTGVVSTIFKPNLLTRADMDDLFQEACLILMRKVKEDQFVVLRNRGVFNFLIKTVEFLSNNYVRKMKPVYKEDLLGDSDPKQKDKRDFDLSAEEKQRTQDEFLDRIFASIPPDCQRIVKYFYWDHKPMDEIASIMGMKNAVSVTTKKTKCMSKFKDIAKQLIENDEFAEDVVRNAVERAALMEFLEQEKANENDGFTMAAYNPDED
jgi:RNA polymerase sigma factor (sigma-70 family)